MRRNTMIGALIIIAIALTGCPDDDGTPAASHPSPAAPTGEPDLGGDLGPQARALLGVWRTNVAGASWTSPSGYDGYDWLHVSSGAAAGDLIIKPDRTYIWASYGGKSGAWRETGQSDYPIELTDTTEKKVWKVGTNDQNPGQIYVWDGDATTYNGRR